MTRIATCLMTCLLLLVCSPARAQGLAPGQPASEFQVLDVRGTAWVVRPGFQQVSISTKGFTVAANDEIETGFDGYVRIGLKDGSQMEILANSHVQLGNPKPSWMKAMDIFLGRVRIVIEHLSGKPNPYTFGTPTAVLGVRGTKFDVGVDASTATIVAVNDGAVRVENSRYLGRGVLVKKGHRTIVRPNELPTKPERFTGDGTNPATMASKHGRRMDEQNNGMMSGSQSGTMQPGSGSLGMPGGGSTGSGGMSMPGSRPGGGMPGMGGHR